MQEHRDRFPDDVRSVLDDLARISKRVRKERELAFSGDLDFIPTEEYSLEDAHQAQGEARQVLEVAGRVIKP